MDRLEAFGLMLVLAVLVATPAAIFTAQHAISSTPDTYTIVAHIAEDGGFTPHQITVVQGHQIHLRVTSADVSHGFSVPDLNINIPEVYPGKYFDVDFTPTKTGTFPFVCTVLCSPRHGEMNGQIVVLAAGANVPGQAGATSGNAAAPGVASAATSAVASAAANQAASSSGQTANGQASAAEIAAGKTAYQMRCMACHGPNAAGGLKMGNATTADLRWQALGQKFNGDTAAIRTAILTGKGDGGRQLDPAMPHWQGQLTDDQVNAIITYLRYGTK